MAWFRERYPEYYRVRSEREPIRFSTDRRDRFERRTVPPRPFSVSEKIRSSFDPEGMLKGRIADLPRFESAEVMANRVQSELERVSRNKELVANWRRAEDRRRYHPAGRNAWPSNLFGASAEFKVGDAPLRGAAARFARDVLPCVDRVVRRQVLFAKKKAGRGYKVPHRRSWRSLIPC